ncbi:MAG: superinfection exclusion B family protein [Candidatus Scalindua sp.]
MEQLFAWMKLPKRVAWPIVFVCALLLWGPADFNKGLGLDLFVEQYRVWVGVVFLFFLATGLTPLAPWCYEYIRNKIEEKRLIDAAKKRVSDLTPEEKEVLRTYIDKNTRSCDLNIQNGVVSGLMSAGFLVLAFKVSYGGTRGSYTFPVNISDWAWEFLRNHPEILK